MDNHGIVRTSKTRTEEQRQQELGKIKKYRELENHVRSLAVDPNHEPKELFQLTSRLLKLNPEYYTVWNVRRRSLLSGFLSKRSVFCFHRTVYSNASLPSTATSFFANPSTGLSGTIRAGGDSQTTGPGGVIFEDADADEGPDMLTARKQDAEILQSELIFTIPLLQEHPKCYWLWNHRGWTLGQATERLDTAAARKIWLTELRLVSGMLIKDRRNFHAWTYRRAVVARLESPELGGESMVESEFEYTTKMIRVDLSNFSAWHNRSKLIPRLLEERGANETARKEFFDAELTQIQEAVNVGPEDQSLWFYHRFLLLNLIGAAKSSIAPAMTLEERLSYVAQEKRVMQELEEDYHDVKWIQEALMENTLALCQLEGRDLSADEKASLKERTAKLRKLDPMRAGRWQDLAIRHGLA